MGMAKIYRYLSEKSTFTAPVKRFWSTIADEEIIHARVFNEIRAKAQADDPIQVEIDIQMDDLKVFAAEVNARLKQVIAKDVRESEAYSMGASIEAHLDEGNFLKAVKTNDETFTQKLQRMETDTKKHGMIFNNYAKGIS